MGGFTSRREQRLWLSATAVLAGIYGAAVVAGSLVDRFGSETLLGVAFAAGFALAVLAVVGLAWSRGGALEGWVALGVLAAYLMIPVRAGVPPLERTHLFEYGLLAVLLLEAATERKKNGRAVPNPPVLAILAATALGWLDEGLQALLPDRTHDLRDVGVNALAAVVAVAAVETVRRVRRLRADGSAGRGPG